MIGRITDVFKYSGGNEINATLIGQIVNGELVIWWTGNKTILTVEQLIELILFAKIESAPRADLEYTKFIESLITSAMEESPASDLEVDSNPRLNILSQIESDESKDLASYITEGTVLRSLLDAYLIGEMHYRKILTTLCLAGMEQAEASDAASRKIITPVLKSLCESCYSKIAKAHRGIQSTLMANADSAAAINTRAARAIQASPDVSANYAVGEDLTIGRGVNTLSAASIALMRWHWADGDILTIAQTKYARQVDDALYLDGALAFLWEAEQSGDSLIIGQAYSATQNETELEVI